MRIIGGRLRGKKLARLKIDHVRPTTDRIRESLFNILADRIAEKKVLDLFAGTGALGIEALSRGAAHAVFVDRSRRVTALIDKNLAACRIPGDQAEVIQWDVQRNLHCLRSRVGRFQLVFIDPPYHSLALLPALANLSACGCLAANALVVAEHAASRPLPRELAGYRLDDQRRYGKTLVSFLNCVL